MYIYIKKKILMYLSIIIYLLIYIYMYKSTYK